MWDQEREMALKKKALEELRGRLGSPLGTKPSTAVEWAEQLHQRVARARAMLTDVGIALRGPSAAGCPPTSLEMNGERQPGLLGTLEAAAAQAEQLLNEIEEARGLLGQPK